MGFGLIGLISCLIVISIFVGYLMPKLSLLRTIVVLFNLQLGGYGLVWFGLNFDLVWLLSFMAYQPL